MAITDISISEELMTNAPSIKYRGDEGPKSPAEEQMMMADALLKEEYNKYVFDLLEIRPDATPMTLEEFRQMVIAEGQMSGGQPLPQDPTKPVNPFQPKPTGPVLPDRQMAAYGGMMGNDGRRRYGLGSFLKKTVRKIIPNEVADIAVKAAPFIAPFNPLAAGIAAGLGSFDKTGSISGGLKSGLLTYGGGQLARGIGGGMGNLQTGINPMGGFGDATTFGKGLLSNPLQGEGGLSALLNKTKAPTNKLSSSLVDEVALTGANPIDEVALTGGKNVIESQSKNIFGNLPKLIKDNLSKVGLGNNLVTGLLAGGLGASALMGNMTEEEVLDVNRGEGLDVEAIRTEVLEAMKDPSGEALKAIRAKYPFLGTRESKDLTGRAYGGRIGFEFGKSVPPVKMPDPMERMLQNMSEEEKTQFKLMMRMNAERMPKYKLHPNAIPPVKMPSYPREDRAEGGIMDLGGMEKDYRNTGGFVDIGEYEKKDDVPARLSVNEFVMTADAVRGMGDGDIDLGAQRMENLMGAMENKKGAQQMFDVSERLSEVV